jgi:hypothetical protein
MKDKPDEIGTGSNERLPGVKLDELKRASRVGQGGVGKREKDSASLQGTPGRAPWTTQPLGTGDPISSTLMSDINQALFWEQAGALLLTVWRRHPLWIILQL